MNQDLKDLIDMKNQYDDEHDKYLRALADIENMRKNFAKKTADFNEFRYEPLLIDLLGTLDDIDRSIKFDDSLSDGTKIILTSIYKLLNKYGLEEYYPEVGTDFDSEKMEAFCVAEYGDKFINKVVDCTIKGYIYNGKIIRFPKVVVGK